MVSSRSVGRWILNVSVVVAVVSAGVAAVTTGWEAAGRFAVIAGAMVFARRAAVPAPFAGSFAAFLTPGSLPAVAYFTLVAGDWLPPAPADARRSRPSAPVVWVGMIGATSAVLWEMYEWVVEQVKPATMLVGYTDTVMTPGDLHA